MATLPGPREWHGGGLPVLRARPKRGRTRHARLPRMTSPAAFAATAALLAEPPRAAMLQALLSGEALTAGELARVAGIGAPAASAHLTRLAEGGLIAVHPQGRHRYHRLASEEVAAM